MSQSCLDASSTASADHPHQDPFAQVKSDLAFQSAGLIDSLVCFEHCAKMPTGQKRDPMDRMTIGRKLLRSKAGLPQAEGLVASEDFIRAAERYGDHIGEQLSPHSIKKFLSAGKSKGLILPLLDIVFDLSHVPKYFIPTGGIQFDGLALVLNGIDVSRGKQDNTGNLNIKNIFLQVNAQVKTNALLDTSRVDKIDFQNKTHLSPSPPTATPDSQDSEMNEAEQPKSSFGKTRIVPTYCAPGQGACRLDSMRRPFTSVQFVGPEMTRNGLPMGLRVLDERTVQSGRDFVLGKSSAKRLIRAEEVPKEPDKEVRNRSKATVASADIIADGH